MTLTDGGPRAIADRFRGGDAGALERWFAETGALPAAMLRATDAEALLAAAGPLERPRALELCDLIRDLEGRPVREKGQPAEVMVLLDRGSGGVALRLVARLTDGAPGVAADVSVHAACTRDVAFRRAEAHAGTLVAARDRSAAIRYRLLDAAGEPFLEEIGDGSIGLPLAVAALSLVRGRALRTLADRCALTGTITSDGGVGAVAAPGLRGKALAAERAGARRLIVPAGQIEGLTGLGGLRPRDVRTVAQGLRAAGVIRLRVWLAAFGAVAVGLAVLSAVRVDNDAEKRRQERTLAASRTIDRAFALAPTKPRVALRLAAAAAALDERGTEVRRAALAARLPPGLRYLPSLPGRARALSWSEGRVLALTADALLRLDQRARRWRAARRLPGFSVGALTRAGTPVLGGPEGAFTVDAGTGKRTVITRKPVIAVAASRTVAALTREGEIVVRSGATTRRLRRMSGLTAIAVTPSGHVVAGHDDGRLLIERGGRLVRDPRGPIPSRVTMLVAGTFNVVAGDGRSTYPAGDTNDPIDDVGPPSAAAILTLRRAAVAGLRGVSAFNWGGLAPVVRREWFLPGRFDAVALSDDRRSLLMAGDEVAVADAQSGLISPALLTRAIGSGPDGRIAAFDADGALLAWLRPGGEPTLASHGRAGTNWVSVSRDGRSAAQVTSARSARVWNVRTGARRRVALVDGAGRPLKSVFIDVTVLEDGRLVYAEDGATYVLRPGARRPETTYAFGARFSEPVSTTQVLLAKDSTVHLFDTDHTERRRAIEVPDEVITTMDGDARAREFFLGDRTGGIWRWAPYEPRPLERLVQLGGGIVSIGARSDGRMLVVSAFTTRRFSAQYLIDVRAKRTYELPLPDTDLTHEAQFTPDGAGLLMTGSSPVAVHRRDARLSGPAACAAAGLGALPDSEWRAAIGGLPVEQSACP